MNGWPAVILWTALFGAIALIDLRKRRIPDGLIAAAALGALGVAFVNDAVLAGMIGGVAGFGFFWLLRRLSVRAGRPALGLGDVKLAGLVGLVCGAALPLALLVGTAAGALAAVILLVLGRRRTDFFPYGPALAFGAVAALVWGQVTAG